MFGSDFDLKKYGINSVADYSAFLTFGGGASLLEMYADLMANYGAPETGLAAGLASLGLKKGLDAIAVGRAARRKEEAESASQILEKYRTHGMFEKDIFELELALDEFRRGLSKKLRPELRAENAASKLTKIHKTAK